jgi:hypothetical protein
LCRCRLSVGGGGVVVIINTTTTTCDLPVVSVVETFVAVTAAAFTIRLRSLVRRILLFFMFRDAVALKSYQHHDGKCDERHDNGDSGIAAIYHGDDVVHALYTTTYRDADDFFMFFCAHILIDNNGISTANTPCVSILVKVQ